MARRALFAVKDVSNVSVFARALVSEFGFEIVANALAGVEFEAKGIRFTAIEDEDLADFLRSAKGGIDLVVANFVDVETAGRSFMSWKSALGAFDRGIVDVIRAAAWAVDRVAVLGNPADYEAALDELRANEGRFGQGFRMQRATSALRAASEFDFAVAQYLEVQGADAPDMGALSGYAKAMRLAWPRAELLNTGENGHQLAALYGSFFEHFRQVSGGKLSYAGVLTVSRAAYLIGEFEKPAAALLRSGKIVTAVCGSDIDAVLERVLKHEDTQGSWLVLNGSLAGDRDQGGVYLEYALEKGVCGILAPDFSEEEVAALKGAEGVTALASVSGLGAEALQEVRSVIGGVLVQDRDRVGINPMEWQALGLAQPLVEDWESLVFGAKVVRHADSASLAVVSGERLISLESGHYSTGRAWQAVEESGIGLANTVAVFDSLEVEPQTLLSMKELGVRAVLVAGLVESEALREAANECGLVLLGTSKGLSRL